jgi:hypothetical protein
MIWMQPKETENNLGIFGEDCFYRKTSQKIFPLHNNTAYCTLLLWLGINVTACLRIIKVMNLDILGAAP